MLVTSEQLIDDVVDAARDYLEDPNQTNWMILQFVVETHDSYPWGTMGCDRCGAYPLTLDIARGMGNNIYCNLDFGGPTCFEQVVADKLTGTS